MKAKFVSESINFERGMDPKDSMEIGRRGKRAMDNMIPGVIYISSMPRWDYYWWFKNPKNNKIYRAFRLKRDDEYKIQPWDNSSVVNQLTEEDFPLDLKPTKKHFDKFMARVNSNIDEAQNFERGGDPKDTIQIGRKYIWNMTAEELAEHILEVVSNKVRPILDKIEAAIKEAGFENVETYQNHIYDYFDNHDEFPKVSQKIDDAEQELEEEIRKECLNYPIKTGVNPNNKVSYMESLVSDLFTLMIEGGPHGTYVQMIKSKLDPSYLKESINFKRNQSPLKSLGIGQKELKRKLLDIMPNLSKNLLWDEMYKNIVTGINLPDTTISMNDKYIIVTTPRLTWRFADNLRLMLNMSDQIANKDVQLENKPSREYIYLRDSDWMKNYKTPRVYKYRIS